jgi:hypothetical protein
MIGAFEVRPILWTPEFASSPYQHRRIAQGCVTGVRHGDSSSAPIQQTRLSPAGWVTLEEQRREILGSAEAPANSKIMVVK